MNFKRGQKLGEQYPYCLIRRVGEGEGGQSFVYLATLEDNLEHPRPLDLVAVKIANVSDERHAQLYERTLNNEVEILRQVDHRNVVRIYPIRGRTGRSGTSRYAARASALPGQPWFTVMEFLAGGSLGMLLDKKEYRRLEEGLALHIAFQVALALSALHEAGYVHLDLKPENVVFRYPLTSGKVVPVLVDFGIARPIGRPGLEGGTFPYISPERLAYRRALNDKAPERVKPVPPHPAMDIYTLGLVLYRMVTGRLPFERQRDRATSAILSGKLTPPSAYFSGIDSRLEEFIMRMLALHPEERPPMGEVVETLDRLARDRRPFEVPRWDPLQVTGGYSRKQFGLPRRRLAAVGGVVGLLGLILVGIALPFLSERPSDVQPIAADIQTTTTAVMIVSTASPPLLLTTSTPVPIPATPTSVREGGALPPTSTPVPLPTVTATPTVTPTVSPTRAAQSPPRRGGEANSTQSVAPSPVEIRILDYVRDTSDPLIRIVVQPVGLQPGQRLALLMGKEGSPMTEVPVTWRFDEGQQAYVGDVQGPPQGPGSYQWTVVAVDGAGQQVGQGPTHVLTWREKSENDGNGSQNGEGPAYPWPEEGGTR